MGDQRETSSENIDEAAVPSDERSRVEPRPSSVGEIQRRCSIGCDEFLAINVVLQRDKAMNNEGTIMTRRGLLKRFSRRVFWIDRAEADRTALH